VSATLRELVNQARRAFTAAGIDSDEAAIDGEVLARHVLGWDRTQWVLHSNEPPPPSFADQFTPLVERRTRREPVAYIVGHREFWGREFIVTPAVLIPRPETELVIEEALALRASGVAINRLIDVGTGSGCLAVTLAAELPEAQITATDISRDALGVAAENARRLGVSDRVQMVNADLLAGTGQADLIVANPPYVGREENVAIQPEVVDFEPHMALFADGHGLAVIERLLDEAPAHLAPGGHLIVEFGFGQDARVADAAQARGWTAARIRKDLQGIPRTAVLRRNTRG
jgi:release factor glutamine methyltransferase